MECPESAAACTVADADADPLGGTGQPVAGGSI